MEYFRSRPEAIATAFDGEHVHVVIAKILFAETTPLSTIRDDVPDALASLIAAMMHNDPSLRPASDEVLARLAGATRSSSEPFAET